MTKINNQNRNNSTNAAFPGGTRNDGTEWQVDLIYRNSLDDSLKPVTAVFAIVRSQGKILAVSPPRGWDIPGGHVEDGESVLEALTREVFEEAGFRITSAQPFVYLRTNYNPEMYTYMIVFNALGELQEPFAPQHEVLERALMDIDDFLENYHGGPNLLMERLVRNGEHANLLDDHMVC
jgi:ADP-ribose pyrophosphatase YjhB (NUDIX family)